MVQHFALAQTTAIMPGVSTDNAAFNPPLHGPRLHLEPLAPRHAGPLFAVLADPALYLHLDQDPPQSAQQLRDAYTRMQRRRSPDGRELWLNWVLYDADPLPLGYVQASVLADGRAWVAWVLGRHAWGQGYAAEAARAMLRHLLGPLHVRQAMACVEQANVRSLSLARRLGFRQALGHERAGLDLAASEQLWLLDGG